MALQRLTYLHIFTGAPDGALPSYGALVSLDGKLYGTTPSGGTNSDGTVYSVTPSGEENVVYRFTGTPDGENPYGGLATLDGTLYGTTHAGGLDRGTVFSVTPTGTEHVIDRFYNGSDGAFPRAGLTAVGSRLYGTTSLGGAYNRGAVYWVRASGGVTVLHSFAGEPGDGEGPWAPLLSDGNVMYGTTRNGGTYDEGTLFKIDKSTGRETVLHNFGGSGDGRKPLSGKLVLVNGVLYGTTSLGGEHDSGTVYSISPGSPRSYAMAYSFQGTTDGCGPSAGLVLYKKLLYGTAYQCGTYASGTIFAIDPTSHAFTLVWAFGGAPGGAGPRSDLVVFNGTIYGTTYLGGQNGVGTVFGLTSGL